MELNFFIHIFTFIQNTITGGTKTPSHGTDINLQRIASRHADPKVLNASILTWHGSRPVRMSVFINHLQRRQVNQIRQEFTCETMTQLRRSMANCSYVPLAVGCQKYVCCFLCVFVGLTTSDKLWSFLTSINSQGPGSGYTTEDWSPTVKRRLTTTTLLP